MLACNVTLINSVISRRGNLFRVQRVYNRKHTRTYEASLENHAEDVTYMAALALGSLGLLHW